MPHEEKGAEYKLLAVGESKFTSLLDISWLQRVTNVDSAAHDKQMVR
jgi:hypothetical protein